jgi:hypothetical protein
MKFKRSIVLFLVLLLLSMTACGGQTAEAEPVYRVLVLTEDDQPVKGAMVQLCKDVCIPCVTDEQGEAVFAVEDEGYKVSFAVLPEGYEYVDETREFHFAPGSRVLTIRLKQK